MTRSAGHYFAHAAPNKLEQAAASFGLAVPDRLSCSRNHHLWASGRMVSPACFRCQTHNNTTPVQPSSSIEASAFFLSAPGPFYRERLRLQPQKDFSTSLRSDMRQSPQLPSPTRQSLRQHTTYTSTCHKWHFLSLVTSCTLRLQVLFRPTPIFRFTPRFVSRKNLAKQHRCLELW